MVQTDHHPQNFAERLIYHTLLGTWALWLVGGLYIAGPVIAWILAIHAGWRYFLSPGLPVEQRPRTLPWIIWFWISAMGVMLICLWIGHVNFELGIGQTIKSSVGWAKGWALLAIFLFVGAALHVRAAIIYRAVCKLGLQTLILMPVFLAAPYLGLPETLYVSPTQIVGGPGPEYFSTILYTVPQGVGLPRWQFFAPWSPAAGMIAILHIVCAVQETDRRWKVIGISAGLLVAVLCQSRLALVALLIVIPAAFVISRIHKPVIWLAAAPILLTASMFSIPLIEAAEGIRSDFEHARADSTRVRATLGRVAIERWKEEAPWFGHGVVEKGPHLVEYMMIGSHHSWYGLLFVKGLIGLLALAVPMTVTLFLLMKQAHQNPDTRAALSLMLLLSLYSFGENLEILAYLFWPALILIGASLRSQRTA